MAKLISVLVVGFFALITRAATPLDPASIPLPSIPDRTFNITEFGAVGDGKTLNTDAIKKAIDACRVAGGGRVVIPAGDFATGPFQFVSNMNLHLERGATLRPVADAKHYRVSRVELYPGKEDDSFENCIQASNCHDISITGEGTIDGQGEYWWTNWDVRRPTPENPAKTHRPHLIVLDGCMRVLVRDVTLLNSPMFHLIPRRCRDVRIEGIKIKAPPTSHNTDGIDPSGWNIYIANCMIDCGDDVVVFKPDYAGPNGEPAVENALVENITAWHGHGISIGGQTRGGLRNVVIRNCTFNGTTSGIRLKANVGNGGLVEDVLFENLTMKNVREAIVFTSHYQKPIKTPTTAPAVEASTQYIPRWRNIVVRNVTAEGSKLAGRMWGLPNAPIEDVAFENVRIEAETPLDITFANGVTVKNSSVPISAGMPLIPATRMPETQPAAR
ncbi:MAG: glycoside hydrolase family 28 protein [Anaerolineae bacterium]|nr:glycoside hydrolase family 28 protein [Phycisphaerae bacterium]